MSLKPSPKLIAVLTPIATAIVGTVLAVLVTHGILGSARVSVVTQQVVPWVAFGLGYAAVWLGNLAWVKHLEKQLGVPADLWSELLAKVAQLEQNTAGTREVLATIAARNQILEAALARFPGAIQPAPAEPSPF